MFWYLIIGAIFSTASILISGDYKTDITRRWFTVTLLWPFTMFFILLFIIKEVNELKNSN